MEEEQGGCCSRVVKYVYGVGRGKQLGRLSTKCYT